MAGESTMSITKTLLRHLTLVTGLLAGLLAATPGVAVAQTNGTWSATTGGAWGTASNWAASQIAGGASGTAVFTSGITGIQTVTLDGDRTIGSIRLGSGGGANIFSLQMGTSGTLTLQSSVVPSIDVATSRSGVIGLSLAGNQGFTKTGTGTLYVQGANTYTGTTTASAGTLELNSSTAFGASGVGNETVVTGNGPARVRIGGTTSTAESFIVSGTGTSNTGAINFGSSQSGVFTTGTITGKITLSGAAQIGSASSCLGVLDRLGAGDAIDNAGFDFTFTGAGSLKVNSPIVGAGSFTHNGSGDVTLTAANTYTGTTGWTTATGNLWLGDGGTGGSLSTSSVITLSNANAKFGVNQSDTVTQGVDFSGSAITGNGQFTQAGSGTTILNAANSYKGATNVNAGTLLINGNQSSATGALTVQSGATLGGTGTTGGSVSILGGGYLAPGSSGAGTLTTSGTFGLDSASILSFQLNAGDNAVGGGVNDLVTGVTNFFTLDGVLNISSLGGDWTNVADLTKWRLFNYTGTLTDNTLTIGSRPETQPWQPMQIDTSIPGQVNLVVVPEPSTYVLLSSVALAGLFVRRRRA